MEQIKVSEAMIKKVITIPESMTVRNAGLTMKSTTHRGFPVLDNDGRLRGMVTYQDINKALNSGRGDIPVAEIMARDLIVCYPEETLMDTLKKLGERNIGRIPVVEYKDHEHLIGLITRKGIISAYNEKLHRKSE
jgi:CIC family chloride channel protein